MKKVFLFGVLAMLLSVFSPGTIALSFAEEVKVQKISDPLEAVNRKIYAFNKVLDKVIIRPIATTYRKIFPAEVRKRISRPFQNLREPLNAINAGLQGDSKQSLVSIWRFAINSSIGVGGLFDVAGKVGLPHRAEDFGQTLGVYGVGEGPYLVLPIIGPSDTRDVFGRVIDAVTDPFNYAFEPAGVTARSLGEGLVIRESLLDTLDEVDRVSLDPYATIRSSYIQRRQNLINNGAEQE